MISIIVYPPPRLSRRACHQAASVSSLESLSWSPLLDRLSWIASSGSPLLDRLSWIACPGSPLLDRLSWIASPGSPLLDRLERNLLGPDHPVTQVSRDRLRDFLSSSFLACFSSRSRAALFRAWRRKTSQNGAQNLPKWSPKRVRNRPYVENTEK